MWLDEFAADSCGSFLFVGGLPERMSGSDIATAFADYAVLPPSQHRCAREQTSGGPASCTCLRSLAAFN